MNKQPILLASGSPRRRELLEAAGYRFEVVVPSDGAECGVCSGEGPAELVGQLALRKATDVAGQLADRDVVPGTILIAADTVAECNGQILGKPANEEHARQMLLQLSGTLHRVYTGICVWQLDTKPALMKITPIVRVEVTTLRMDTLGDDQLQDYLDSGQWEGKAGAFGYQDRLGWIHVQEGSESNVVGLPMETLAEMLEDI